MSAQPPTGDNPSGSLWEACGNSGHSGAYLAGRMERMNLKDKYYIYETEESIDRYAGMHVQENGQYLCVRWWEHPLHVYKLIQPGEYIHPFTQQIEHNGKSYRLEFIEDEKEHATSRRVA
jgi:hypothetical protein